MKPQQPDVETSRRARAPAGARARYRIFETKLGTCGLAWTQTGLTHVQLPERDVDATEGRLQRRMADPWDKPPPPHISRWISLLQTYLDGVPTEFGEVELDISGVSAFNAEIYRALRKLAWGQTTSYGALAVQIGAPGAARAVGMAMSKNPWPIIVPCHRVLAAARQIGGFSAFGGAGTKLRLLQLEGVNPNAKAPMLPGLF